MIIDCVSDLHGKFPELEGGDLLIMAGDCTSNDRVPAWCKFFEWCDKQEYKHKILIAGNHDGFLSQCIPSSDTREILGELHEGCEYLCDSGITIEGLKIWGSPWTPTFYDWYFMKDRGADIKAMWDLIPEDTDILITHGPPYGILDTNKQGHHCGCEELREAVMRVKPTLHIFGHIHGGYGKQTSLWPNGEAVTFINAAHMNEDYEPVNKPIRVII